MYSGFSKKKLSTRAGPNTDWGQPHSLNHINSFSLLQYEELLEIVNCFYQDLIMFSDDNT